MFPKLRDKLNPSTLSGALDIVVVEHPDGQLRSSAWHVRFGKLGLLHHSGKLITVTINNKSAPFQMYVDSEGRGRFFETQEVVPRQMNRSTSFPSVGAATVNIGPRDVRSILSADSIAKPPPSRELGCWSFFRDSAVDLEAALLYEDPDPSPLATLSASVDLAQAVGSGDRHLIDSSEAHFNPVPSAVLLQSIRPLLHENENSVAFTVSSLLQGPKTAIATLFLWEADSRLAVSDVDGTVTKSDLLGHVLPTLGRDWTHPGLAKLYKRIEAHGVKFVYLSSRPIGQAPVTRSYLQRIDQEGDMMPKGALITAPDALFIAVQREIKRKPHEFKIPTLRGICDLFESENSPFVIGFGNRKTDVMSYRGIDMKDDQIFLFNPKHNVMNAGHEVIFDSISDMTSEIDAIMGRCLAAENN
jgi:phosphatidate phosphatase LPIN